MRRRSLARRIAPLSFFALISGGALAGSGTLVAPALLLWLAGMLGAAFVALRATRSSSD